MSDFKIETEVIVSKSEIRSFVLKGILSLSNKALFLCHRQIGLYYHDNNEKSLNEFYEVEFFPRIKTS